MYVAQHLPSKWGKKNNTSVQEKNCEYIHAIQFSFTVRGKAVNSYCDKIKLYLRQHGKKVIF